MPTFSLKEYLINNKLAEDTGFDVKLIPSDWEISEVAHLITSCDETEMKIILGSLIISFSDNRWEDLKKLQFSLTKNKEDMWQAFFSWKDKSSYHGMQWWLVTGAVGTMITYMAPSNVSYLAEQIVNDL